MNDSETSFLPVLERHLGELGCRALLVLADSSRDPCLAPFVGPVRLGESLLVVPRGGPPRLGFLTPMERREAAASGLELLTPETLDVERWSRGGARPHEILADVVGRALHLSELAPGRLAVAGSLDAGRLLGAAEILATEGWSFVAGEPLVRLLRKAKTRRQVRTLAAVAAGAGAALRRVAELLAAAALRRGELVLASEPLTVARLGCEIRRVLLDHGLAEPRGHMVAAAEEGAVPHTPGSGDRVLRPGESLVVDLFPGEAVPWGSLHADCSRTFCVGEPPPALAAAHGRVVEALALARRRVRPDVCCWSLQEAVCEHFRSVGYETPISHPGTRRGYVHGLGHGVGYELHEAPSFRQNAPAAEGTFAAGDVFVLEPGLYDPEAGWAMRLEDLYVLGAEGLRNLTPLPYALDPRAW